MTSLLGLVGITADPLSSREHVLLSNLVENAWRAGKSLDLGSLIGQIQAPPLRKLGVFEIDAFFPPNERTELALKLNALVALPSFAAWGAGQALDPATLLAPRTASPAARSSTSRTCRLGASVRRHAPPVQARHVDARPAGRPTCGRSRTWTKCSASFRPLRCRRRRSRSSRSSSSRAFGVAHGARDPEPRRPRLQGDGERRHVARRAAPDRARQGPRPRGVALGCGEADVGALDVAIGGLQKRQFLLVSAKSSAPALFATRWAMSYLRGPLTKDQIETITQDAPRPEPARSPWKLPPRAQRRPGPRPTRAPSRPRWRTASRSASWIPPRRGRPRSAPRPTEAACTRPRRARLLVSTTRRPTSTTPRSGRRCAPRRGLDLDSETPVDYDGTSAPSRRRTATTCCLRRRSARRSSSVTRRRRSSGGSSTTGRSRSSATARWLSSRPGETPEQFAERCDQAGQAEADHETAKLRDRLEAKRDRLEDALDTARRRVEARLDRAVAPDDRAHRRCGLGARRPPRRARSTRSIASSVGSAASRRASARGPRA